MFCQTLTELIAIILCRKYYLTRRLADVRLSFFDLPTSDYFSGILNFTVGGVVPSSEWRNVILFSICYYVKKV